MDTATRTISGKTLLWVIAINSVIPLLILPLMEHFIIGGRVNNTFGEKFFRYIVAGPFLFVPIALVCALSVYLLSRFSYSFKRSYNLVVYPLLFSIPWFLFTLGLSYTPVNDGLMPYLNNFSHIVLGSIITAVICGIISAVVANGQTGSQVNPADSSARSGLFNKTLYILLLVPLWFLFQSAYVFVTHDLLKNYSPVLTLTLEQFVIHFAVVTSTGVFVQSVFVLNRLVRLNMLVILVLSTLLVLILVVPVMLMLQFSYNSTSALAGTLELYGNITLPVALNCWLGLLLARTITKQATVATSTD